MYSVKSNPWRRPLSSLCVWGALCFLKFRANTPETKSIFRVHLTNEFWGEVPQGCVTRNCDMQSRKRATVTISVTSRTPATQFNWLLGIREDAKVIGSHQLWQRARSIKVNHTGKMFWTKKQKQMYQVIPSVKHVLYRQGRVITIKLKVRTISPKSNKRGCRTKPGSFRSKVKNRSVLDHWKE